MSGWRGDGASRRFSHSALAPRMCVWERSENTKKKKTMKNTQSVARAHSMCRGFGPKTDVTVASISQAASHHAALQSAI